MRALPAIVGAVVVGAAVVLVIVVLLGLTPRSEPDVSLSLTNLNGRSSGLDIVAQPGDTIQVELTLKNVNLDSKPAVVMIRSSPSQTSQVTVLGRIQYQGHDDRLSGSVVTHSPSLLRFVPKSGRYRVLVVVAEGMGYANGLIADAIGTRGARFHVELPRQPVQVPSPLPCAKALRSSVTGPDETEREELLGRRPLPGHNRPDLVITPRMVAAVFAGIEMADSGMCVFTLGTSGSGTGPAPRALPRPRWDASSAWSGGG